MAVSEAIDETSTNKISSLKTCFPTSSKELINTPNISDFAAIEDLSTERSFSADFEFSLLVATKEMGQWGIKVYKICKRCFVRFSSNNFGAIFKALLNYWFA